MGRIPNGSDLDKLVREYYLIAELFSSSMISFRVTCTLTCIKVARTTTTKRISNESVGDTINHESLAMKGFDKSGSRNESNLHGLLSLVRAMRQQPALRERHKILLRILEGTVQSCKAQKSRSIDIQKFVQINIS